MQINNIDYSGKDTVLVSFISTINDTTRVTYVKISKPLNEDGSVNQDILQAKIEDFRLALMQKMESLDGEPKILKPAMPAPFVVEDEAPSVQPTKRKRATKKQITEE